mgnify:CR=1 FL=1
MKLSESLVLGKARVDSLVNVKNLNVWGNSLSDISVIQKMPNIEVASLSVNCIDSLKDFSNCMFGLFVLLSSFAFACEQMKAFLLFLHNTINN